MDLLDCSCNVAVFFLHTGSTGQEATITKELGESIVLPCLDRPVNTTLSVTRWFKGNVVLATHNHSNAPHISTHISILDNSSLSITGLLTIDEEVYHCETEPRSPGEPHNVRLLIIGTLECRGTKKPKRHVWLRGVCKGVHGSFCEVRDPVRNGFGRFTSLCDL